MRIGIDVSQLAYPKTGVANYLYQLVDHLIQKDTENQYVLFYSSFRRKPNADILKFQHYQNVSLKIFRFPPSFLNVVWNTLHIFPIESLIGSVDVFISSDWVQPPSKAKKVTIIYDLIVYRYPEETDRKIVETQKRKLSWVKKEGDKILCISEATRKDIEEILKIPESKIAVIYPGL